ncbi:tyrosine-type recombinase/integrase [Kallotenue papyrolyticum]|uniref:tyrosine-type recombinase/integrase n=1 Tax=Kallotenue papyrolyticum TaxID=1325125 RepID=UPI00049231A7
MHAPLTTFLPDYCAALRAAGRRPRGIEKYHHTMLRFIAWLGEGATQADITAESIQRYQEQLAARCSASTVCNALSTIRSFCRWSRRRGYRQDDPTEQAEWPRRRRPLPRPYTKREIGALLAALDGDDPVTRRNRRAVLLMLYAGLRISETAALEWRDIDLDHGELVVRDGKGGKMRRIPLHPRLRAELETVPVSERQPIRAVVGQPNGEPLTLKALGHVFDRWLRRRGIIATAHRLRHTFATELLRNGANIRYIQELLGHQDISTTEIYLGVYQDGLRDAIERLPTW